MGAYKHAVAFSVQEEDEGTGGIVFAKSSIAALREGASEYGGGDIYGWRATRAQWADQYAVTGNVPMSAAVESGWWAECVGCGHTINESSLEDRGLQPSDVIGTLRGSAYCCQKCVDDEAERSRREALAKSEVIARFSSLILKRFPDAILDLPETDRWSKPSVYITRDWIVQQVVIPFGFPGQKVSPATLRYDEADWRHKHLPVQPEYFCAYGDRKAFEAWMSRPSPEPRHDR